MSHHILLNQVASAQGSTELEVGDHAFFTFQALGSYVANVALEGTVSGNTWIPLRCENLSNGDFSQTITPGLWRAYVVGLYKLRARVVSHTSGAVTLHGRLAR